MNQLDQMIAWEQGDLDEEGTIALFQSLVDSGLAWQLQGAYGRQAMALIEDGYICHKLVQPRHGFHDCYWRPSLATEE